MLGQYVTILLNGDLVSTQADCFETINIWILQYLCVKKTNRRVNLSASQVQTSHQLSRPFLSDRDARAETRFVKQFYLYKYIAHWRFTRMPSSQSETQ